MSLPLWDHQAYAVRTVVNLAADGRRAICVTSPTGGGKSRIIEELALEWLNRHQRVILYANRRLLIEQLVRDFTLAGIDHGVRAAKYDADPDALFQVSSLQTEVSRHLDDLTLFDARLVLVDEAHLQTGDKALEILTWHLGRGAVVVGVTATPIGLGVIYRELVVAGTNSSLRQIGALVRAVHFAPDEPDIRSIRRLIDNDGTEPRDKNAMKAMGPRPQLIGRVWRHYEALNPERKPCILFAPGVEEAHWFAQQFTAKGVPAASIAGDTCWYGDWTDDRDHIAERFRAGEVKVLCNRFVLREGLNFPAVEHLIFATVFGSLQTYLQAGGRGLRAYPGKTRCIIQDHGGCLDTDTEILTARGWVGHDGIRDDDTVAAFDRWNGQIVWKPILHRHERTLENGERMFEVKSRCLDIRVTGNHRFLFNKRVNEGCQKVWPDNFDFIRADELAASNWRFQIPVSGVQQTRGLQLTDDELRFIGWFVTDGTMAGERQAVSITQADHQPQIADLRACLVGCGFSFRERKRKPAYFTGSNMQTQFDIPKGTSLARPRRGWWPLRNYLDKNLSRNLELMDERQFGVFLHAVHLGDGDKAKGDGSYRISTGNKTFADNLQSLAVRKGWKCNISVEISGRPKPIYILHLQRVATSTVHGQHAATADQQARVTESPCIPGVTRVWCVANELETLVTRRNGKVAIIGNSWWRHGSLNADRDWNLGYTPAMVAAMREDRMRDRKEPEPGRCPRCGVVVGQIRVGATCPECGYVWTREYRVRAVVTTDGELKELSGHVYRKRVVALKKNTAMLWAQVYWRLRKAKSKKFTFRQAIGWFEHQFHYQPPRDIKWMPRHERDIYRLITEVPFEDLHGYEPKEPAR